MILEKMNLETHSSRYLDNIWRFSYFIDLEITYLIFRANELKIFKFRQLSILIEHDSTKKPPLSFHSKAFETDVSRAHRENSIASPFRLAGRIEALIPSSIASLNSQRLLVRWYLLIHDTATECT